MTDEQKTLERFEKWFKGVEALAKEEWQSDLVEVVKQSFLVGHNAGYNEGYKVGHGIGVKLRDPDTVRETAEEETEIESYD